jgi:hypothetical protein
LVSIKHLSCHERIIKSIPLTTNICEGWHRGLNSLFNCSHPDFNVVLKEFKTKDTIQQFSIIEALKSDVKVCTSEKEVAIRKICESYDSYYDLTFITSIASIYSFKLNK